MVEGEKVYIGGDSVGVAGYEADVRADAKVFRNGPMIFGFTSSFRMGQLLRYSLVVPQRHPETDVYAWLVTTFIDAVRACLDRGGYSRRVNGEEEAGTFLIGYAGRLFAVQDDYQVAEVARSYQAVGCGATYALGALHATDARSAAYVLGQRLDPILRLTIALGAASEHSAGVRGPYRFEILEG
jgi:hypothetical protein